MKRLSAGEKIVIFSGPKLNACADPENVVRGGPTLRGLFFSLSRGGRIKIPLLAGHHQPASETPFRWRFAGVPMMA